MAANSQELGQELATRLHERSPQGFLFIDFDGTLAPIARLPNEVTLPTAQLDLLNLIGRTTQLRPIIVSGRSSEDLDRYFGSGNIGLVAEHGARYFESGTQKWKEVPYQANRIPVESIAACLEEIVSRYPGTGVERKECSVAFHYRNAKMDIEANLPLLLREIDKCVSTRLSSQADGVPHWALMRGKKVIEVLSRGVGKGIFIEWFLSRREPGAAELLIAIGDDETDEEMFRVINKRGGLSVKVGELSTVARYRVPDVSSVTEILTKIAHVVPSN